MFVVAIPVLVGLALYDKHGTGLACIAHAKPYKLGMLHGFWVCVLAQVSSTFVAPQRGFCTTLAYPIREMGLLICKKCTCELQHWQPAQRTMFQDMFDGLSWVLDSSCSQLSQNGVQFISTIGTPFWLKLRKNKTLKPYNTHLKIWC